MSVFCGYSASSTQNLARCEEFARQGCKVYATSRRVETIGQSSFPSVERLALDVTEDESVNKAVEYIIDKEGRLDIVVNNAGAISPGAFRLPQPWALSAEILFQVHSLTSLWKRSKNCWT